MRFFKKTKVPVGNGIRGRAYWVEHEHETALCRLVDAVTAVQAG